MSVVKMTLNELNTELTAEELQELETDAVQTFKQAEPNETYDLLAYFSRNTAESQTIWERLHRITEPPA